MGRRRGIGSLLLTRRRLLVVGLLALALAVRLLFLAATPAFTPQLDAAHYDGLACGLLLGEGFVLRPPSERTASSCGRPSEVDSNPPTAFRPPGWPAVLTVVYAVEEEGRWARARVVQALIGTAVVALVGLLAYLLLGPTAALAALALGAVDATLVVVGGSLLSEPLFVALSTGALCAAAAARRSDRPLRLLLAAGALAGLATLVRSNGIVLVPVLAVLAAPVRGQLLRAGALVAIGTVVVVAPWTVRNAVMMESFVPVASYLGTGLSGTFNDTARTREDFPGGWVSPRHVEAFRDVHHSDLDEVERQRELTSRALDYAREHPSYALEAGVRNVGRILAITDRGWHRGNAGAMSLPRWSGTVAAVGFLVLLAIAAIGGFTAAGRTLPWALWLVPVVFLVSAMWFGGEARYRAPLVPVVIIAASACACRGARGTARARRTYRPRSGVRARPPR
jgi:4-amino-4-deoxy-L-arabinose transferase-like glycosyltransferase